MARPHVATILRVVSLSLLTFVAFGASWQLASAAAAEGSAATPIAIRAETIARGGRVSLDPRLIRATVSGISLVLGGGIPVSLVDSGQTQNLRAPRGATVADVLALSGVDLGPLDQTVPADRGQTVSAGDVVRVVRVSETNVAVQEPVPFPVQKVADASLPSGRVVVTKAGTPGLAENTYTVRMADGVETGRTLVSAVELVAPVPEVQHVGTAALAPVPAPADIQAIIVAAAQRWGADQTQLLRVAYCESHYNPNAYNASSGASGLFQFLASTWAANSVRAGYAGASVFDPVANANTAAYMFANGQAGQWSCK